MASGADVPQEIVQHTTGGRMAGLVVCHHVVMDLGGASRTARRSRSGVVARRWGARTAGRGAELVRPLTCFPALPGRSRGYRLRPGCLVARSAMAESVECACAVRGIDRSGSARDDVVSVTRQAQLEFDTDAGGKCLASELPVDWSQSGPTGATGATGATGPTGQQGPPGPSPTLSVYEADGPFVTIPAGDVKGIGADCSSTGDLATGGGFNVGSALVVIASFRNSNTTYSWLLVVFNPTNLDLQPQATVECLRSE
jgi:hypothetical protein